MLGVRKDECKSARKLCCKPERDVLFLHSSLCLERSRRCGPSLQKWRLVPFLVSPGAVFKEQRGQIRHCSTVWHLGCVLPCHVGTSKRQVATLVLEESCVLSHLFCHLFGNCLLQGCCPSVLCHCCMAFVGLFLDLSSLDARLWGHSLTCILGFGSFPSLLLPQPVKFNGWLQGHRCEVLKLVSHWCQEEWESKNKLYWRGILCFSRKYTAYSCSQHTLTKKWNEYQIQNTNANSVAVASAMRQHDCHLNWLVSLLFLNKQLYMEGNTWGLNSVCLLFDLTCSAGF